MWWCGSIRPPCAPAMKSGGGLIYVRLGNSGPAIPREQVVEIRIYRDALLSDALLAPARALFSSGGGGDSYGIDPWQLLLLPVAYGVAAAAAPVSLSVEAISRRPPDKVVRVAP
jgi:hypothetical protein